MNEGRGNRIFIKGFNGNDQIVEADEIRVCLPNKHCIRFWVTIVASFFLAATGIFFMIFQGTESKYFVTGEAMLIFAIGVLFPSPDYGKVFAPSRAPGHHIESINSGPVLMTPREHRDASSPRSPGLTAVFLSDEISVEPIPPDEDALRDHEDQFATAEDSGGD